MDFETAVSLVGTVTDLRRIASAHVIDHNQLKDEELRSALAKSKPLDAAAKTVRAALNNAPKGGIVQDLATALLRAACGREPYTDARREVLA